MINITCNNKEVRSGTCADIGDSNVVAYISFFDTINNTERKLYQPVYGDFKTSTAYLFDLSGNSITLTYADSNKTRTELEDLLVDCCGCVGGDGTVTSFSAGNLSPLFTTNVATPTTTPALSFNLSNCNQYQVFGRVVAGTGAPSYVPLNPIAFNGLAIPNREVAFGNGTGITSSSLFQYTTGNSIKLGIGSVTGDYSINIGNGSSASGYLLNIGGGVINTKGSNSLVICENGSEISGSGNANLSVLMGGNTNKIIAATDTYGSVIIGWVNTITSTTKNSTFNKIFGNYNSITDAQRTNIIGNNNTISASGANYAYDNNIIGINNTISSTGASAYNNNIIGGNNNVSNGNSVNILGSYCNNGGYTGTILLSDGSTSVLGATAHHQFNARFSGGYRFMANGSTQWMAIANTGYVTINNIPTASSATDILVSNGGVVSTRTVASLGIPVITPAALTKTDDTNVTLTLGGTPASALLQSVSMTLGWNGLLSISRGGTGLGTLGTANQVLRVNAGGTALEYATLTDLDAQTLTWTKATSNLAISNGNSVNLFNLTSLTSGDLIKWDGTDWVNFAPNWTTNTGTVTSVAATISGTAITITGSPITTYGTLDFTWMGSIYQYVRGDGTLAYLPASANYLDDLLDVTITSPSTGQLLRYNGSQWVNWTPNFLTSNQTITLSGDVTGSGATSITTTIATNAVTTSKIANTAVTFAKFQNINTNRLLGRSSAGSGSVEEISIGSGLSLSGGTLSASGGGAGNNVWLVQSSGVQATTNIEDIYHVGKVKVGSSGTSSFMLSVSGTTYSSQGMYINNNYPYYGYNTSAVPIIIGKIDSSDRVSLGENNYNIILPAYTSSRSADSLATTDGYLYVTNAGVLNKHEVDLARNEGASVHITSTESHAADSTYRRVTFDTGSWSLYGGYTADYTTGDNKIILPSSVRYHFVIATIEYTTSGTPTVTVDIRKNATTVETNISTSDDERKVMTVHTLMYNASSSQYPTIYIKVSGAAITLQKCKITAIPCGMAGS